MNGRGDASEPAETKLGASDEKAVRPAAIHRPRPANIANCGSADRKPLPVASRIEAMTETAIASHSTHAAMSRARIATGAISVGVRSRSKNALISSVVPIPGSG